MKTFDNQYLMLKGLEDIQAHLTNMGNDGYQLVSAAYDNQAEQWDLFFTKEVIKPAEGMTATRGGVLDNRPYHEFTPDETFILRASITDWLGAVAFTNVLEAHNIRMVESTPIEGQSGRNITEVDRYTKLSDIRFVQDNDKGQARRFKPGAIKILQERAAEYVRFVPLVRND